MAFPITVLAQVTGSASQVHTGLEYYKDLAQIVSYVVGICAAIGAVWTYHQNSQRERAKWVVELYEKYFEDDRYKKIRGILDDDANSDGVESLLDKKTSKQIDAFTDYLNFFELVEFLKRRKQLRDSDAMALFEYYMGCLKRHSGAVNYINDKKNGFELLKQFVSGQDRGD